MKSTLIRYTKPEYISSILSGDLYLSSLSSFWKLNVGARANSISRSMQQDFSEGVGVQIPHDVLNKMFPNEMSKYVIHDARFRVEAYGYCNLLCFFRVDTWSGRQKLIQLPGHDMDSFGQAVIVVKNEEEFINRVINAVRRQGGECIVGDVRYHEMRDGLDSSTMTRHHITMITQAGDPADPHAIGRWMGI